VFYNSLLTTLCDVMSCLLWLIGVAIYDLKLLLHKTVSEIECSIKTGGMQAL
jgi:hypothetical protein